MEAINFFYTKHLTHVRIPGLTGAQSGPRRSAAGGAGDAGAGDARANSGVVADAPTAGAGSGAGVAAVVGVSIGTVAIAATVAALVCRVTVLVITGWSAGAVGAAGAASGTAGACPSRMEHLSMPFSVVSICLGSGSPIQKLCRTNGLENQYANSELFYTVLSMSILAKTSSLLSRSDVNQAPRRTNTQVNRWIPAPYFEARQGSSNLFSSVSTLSG